MIEQIARALAGAVWEETEAHVARPLYVDRYWQQHKDHARVVLRAMQTASDAMVAAGMFAGLDVGLAFESSKGDGQVSAIWQAMINEALR